MVGPLRRSPSSPSYVTSSKCSPPVFAAGEAIRRFLSFEYEEGFLSFEQEEGFLSFE